MAATNGGFQATDDVEASKVPNANEQATDNSNNQTRRILEVDYRNTKQSAICSIIVFLALILILGAVVVVLVFLLDGQNGGPDREQQTELLRGPFTVSASITIVNLDYTEALSDSNSRDFIDLDDRFQSKLASVLSETSLKDTYRGVEITNVRSGSVIVDCLLLFCDPMATADDVIQTLLDAFTSQTSPANAVDDDLIISNNNVNVDAASAQTTSIKLSCSATTQTTTMLMTSSTSGVTTTASFTSMVASPAPTSTPVLSSTSASTPMLSPTSTPALSSTPALEPTSTPEVSSSTSPGLSSSTPVPTATFEMSSVPQVSTQMMSSLTLTTSPDMSSQSTSSPTSLLSSASTTIAASATQTSVSAVPSAPPISSATLASPPLSSTTTITSETSTPTPVGTTISPTSVPSMSSTITTTSSVVSSGRPTSSFASSSSTPVSSPIMSSSFTPESTPISTPQTAVSSSTTVTTTSTIASSPTLTLQPSSSTVSSSSLALQPSSSATPSSNATPSSSATPLLSSSVAGTSTSLTPSMHVSALSSNSLKSVPTASLPSTSDDLSMTSSVHVASTSPTSSNPTRTAFISPSPSVTSRLVMPSKTILLATSSQTVSFTAEVSLASTQTINIPTEVTMVTTRLTPSAGTSQTAFTTSSASVASLLPSMQLTTSIPSSSPPAIAVNVTSPFTVSTSFSAVQSSSSILSSVSNSFQTFPATTQSQLNSQIVQTTNAVTMSTISGSPSLDMSMTILSTPSLPVMVSSVAMTTTPTQETTTQLLKPSTEEQPSALPTTGTVPPDTVTSTVPTIATCTQSLSVLENSTYFSSSDVIDGATIDFVCTWSYLSLVEGATIMVTFVTFDLGDDELELQLGSDTLIFTGSELPSSVTTDANRIDITLDTNSNTNIVDFVILLELILKDNVIPSITPPYTGTYPPPVTITTTLPGCDPTNAVILTETSVKNITSPGYPRGYLNNLKCEWIYTKIASDAMAIYLEFIAFDMAGEDYLEIETSGSDGQILRYGGSVTPPSVRSYGMTMNLRFITDSTMTATGFEATIRLVSVTEPGCIDSQEVLVPGVNKTVTSPGYPNGYSSNIDCTWTLTSSVTGAQIAVTFVTFDIGDDSLNIQYSGMTFQFTGTNPPMPITTSDNSISVQFTSNDVDNQNPGFQLVAYIFIPPEPTQATQEDPSTPSRQLTASPDLSCTPSSSLLTVKTEPKTLTSPGYPHSNYASNMECSWSYILIDVSETKTIQLHFNFFDVGDDSVIVDDEIQRTTYTGSATPLDIVSASDRVTIKLITDSEDNHPGFEVTISVVDR